MAPTPCAGDSLLAAVSIALLPGAPFRDQIYCKIVANQRS
jgi:hypothetical protein